MEVVAYNIVHHIYTEESVAAVYSVNEIKSDDMEWNKDDNKNHPFAIEIEKHHLVYSIQNIGNAKDEYGFCFIDVEQLPSNYKFEVIEMLLDVNLPESLIQGFCESIVNFIGQKYRNKVEDIFRTDRLFYGSISPISPSAINTTKSKFTERVISLFRMSKNGLVDIPKEQEERLRQVAAKMNDTSE